MYVAGQGPLQRESDRKFKAWCESEADSESDSDYEADSDADSESPSPPRDSTDHGGHGGHGGNASHRPSDIVGPYDGKGRLKRPVGGEVCRGEVLREAGGRGEGGRGEGDRGEGGREEGGRGKGTWRAGGTINSYIGSEGHESGPFGRDGPRDMRRFGDGKKGGDQQSRWEDSRAKAGDRRRHRDEPQQENMWQPFRSYFS